MTYLERIKEFSKISISGICRDLNINRSNMLNQKMSKQRQLKSEKLVLKEIIKRCNSILKK